MEDSRSPKGLRNEREEPGEPGEPGERAKRKKTEETEETKETEETELVGKQFDEKLTICKMDGTSYPIATSSGMKILDVKKKLGEVCQISYYMIALFEKDNEAPLKDELLISSIQTHVLFMLVHHELSDKRLIAKFFEHYILGSSWNVEDGWPKLIQECTNCRLRENFTSICNCEEDDQETWDEGVYRVSESDSTQIASLFLNCTIETRQDMTLKEIIGFATNLKSLVELKLDIWYYGKDTKIPDEILELTNLKKLDLSRGRLTGKIPDEIWKLSKLVKLDLSENRFSGSIPVGLFQLGGLEKLYLIESFDTTSPRTVPRTIPKEIGLLTKLKKLKMSWNGFTGTIPTEIGNLTRLTILKLRGNPLTGDIPDEFKYLESLRELDLGDTQFSGLIPGCLANIPELRRISLYTSKIDMVGYKLFKAFLAKQNPHCRMD
jgi:hypothetical protein